jgi:Protein of unknown function (DUF2442)
MRREADTNQDSAAGVTRVPWWVVDVRVLPQYRLVVRFADGTEGEVHAKPMLFGPRAGVFTALRDARLFDQAYVEHGAVTWPGELDLAPDRMYDEIKAAGSWTISAD